MSNQTNLILGYAYGTADISPFLASLRNLKPTTVVVLFATGLPEATVTACEQAGVRLLPLVSAATVPRRQRSRAWICLLEGALRLHRWLGGVATSDALAVAKIALHPNQSRFLHYRDYLREQGRHYERVFMSDVRDVVFQRDPFEFTPDAPLLVFCEEPANRIGTEKYNRRWVLNTFGRATLKELSEQVVICAGTVAGGRRALLHYLDVFCDVTFRHSFEPSAEQAILNVLVRRRVVPAQVFANRAGLVLTLDRVPEDDLRIDSAHRLVDSAGLPFAMLHMFDRIPRAAAAIKSQFNLP